MLPLLNKTNGFVLFKSISQLINYEGYYVIENQSCNHKGKTKISKFLLLAKKDVEKGLC